MSGVHISTRGSMYVAAGIVAALAISLPGTMRQESLFGVFRWTHIAGAREVWNSAGEFRVGSPFRASLDGAVMSKDSRDAFKSTSLGAKNNAYDLIADLDPEYFEKLKGIYVDGTFGRESTLPRKVKELIMVGITCALRVPRGVRIHADRALTLGATPKEVLEAMEVSAIPGGMPGLWIGVETLKEILEQRGRKFE